ncbi:MAG: ATP-binding protein [Myxococcales bacterium]|nr:ATP-binding protein [Myxococcales bacterium]
MPAILHWVTLIAGALTVLVGIGTLWSAGLEFRHVSANLAVLGVIGVAQALLRRGRTRVAAQLFVFSVWLAIATTSFRSGGSSGPIPATFFAVVATASVLLSRRMALGYAALSVVTMGVLFGLEGTGFRAEDPYTPLLRFIVVAAALLMSGGIGYLAATVNAASTTRANVSETEFAELIRTAPEAILTVDGDGVIRSSNPAAAVLFGANALVGQQLATLPGLEAVPLVGETTVANCLVTRADGTPRTVDVDVRPLRVSGGAGARVSLRDVTTQRQAEQDRARLTGQLHQVQKQESIGLLAGGIAHDFNNLMTAVLVNVELLKEHVPAGEAKELVDEVEQASVRATSLTRQLLAFSRRQVLHARNLSVNEVVEGLRPMLRRLLAANIEMRFTLESRGVVRADSGQLEQVIVNLAVNARDSMPNGGTLHIATGDLELPTVVGNAPAGRYVTLSVEDTGEGMRPEVVARVFEPFFTTKPAGQGTGLGLAVVEGIVRQSGGHVTVHSTVGEGTRFEVLLPRTEVTVPDQVTAPVERRGNGAGLTVLVIEDEAALRKVVTRMLDAAGFRVLVAADGEEAVALMQREAPEVHLVVTDVVMPRLDGPATVRRLREHQPGLKALFVSGYTDRPLEALGATSPNSAFLGKPFRTDELVAALLALHARV